MKVTELQYYMEPFLIRKLDLMIEQCVSKRVKGDALLLIEGDPGTGKTGMSQYTSEYPLEDFTPVILKYGDCVVHNQFSVHYFNENSTDKPRIAITCIMKLNKP